MRWLLLFCAACHSNPAQLGDADTPDAPVVSATTDEIVAACEVDEACAIHAAGANGINDCLRYWTSGRPLLRPDWIHCMAAANGNCVTARACVGQVMTPSTTCTPGATTCNGDQLSQCIGTLGNALELQTNCTALDPSNHCLVNGPSAACGTGPCTSEACDGTKEVRCSGSVAQEYDCASVGDTCVMSTRSECGGTGPACTGPRVDGNAIVYCEYGFEHRVDCAAALPGATVQLGTMSMNGSSNYCGFDTACQPGGPVPGGGCSGNLLTVCAFGQVKTFDCTALGYVGCDGSIAGNRCKPASLF